MQVSFSRVGTFNSCPYKWKLSYKDGLTALPTDDPQSPLVLGHALHTGLEKDVQAAIREYLFAYPIVDDRHINEAIKLENLIPKAKAIIPQGQHEVKMACDDFIGFIDLLVPVGPDEFDIYDFKYSNNVDHYMESGQLHVYKYFFERLNPGKRIRNLYFLFIPKTMIRQKKTEDLYQFRCRLCETLDHMWPELREVQYDPNKVMEFLLDTKRMVECETFEKNPTRLCDWCDFQKFCEEGVDYFMLPKNERIPVGSTQYMKGWIYGPPFSGKTTFLDNAPDPLNLNTDGNTKYVTMQRVRIRDEVTTEGRITKRKFAWAVLKEMIDELEKGSEFKTILVDLVEDTREMCRLYMYDKMDITHESDGGFGKGWDMIKTEYLSTMRRLLQLDYNIFLVSHEDISKDITKKSGERVTRIAPNIQEAVANKLAGMVDFVARVVVEDDDSRWLSFKTNEVVFGGGRLKIDAEKIPLDWDELMKVYAKANATMAAAPVPVPAAPVSAEAVSAPEEIGELVRKTRRRVSE
jgi:hypothetical protein